MPVACTAALLSVAAGAAPNCAAPLPPTGSIFSPEKEHKTGGHEYIFSVATDFKTFLKQKFSLGTSPDSISRLSYTLL
jgi:hypothetical protein